MHRGINTKSRTQFTGATSTNNRITNNSQVSGWLRRPMCLPELCAWSILISGNSGQTTSVAANAAAARTRRTFDFTRNYTCRRHRRRNDARQHPDRMAVPTVSPTWLVRCGFGLGKHPINVEGDRSAGGVGGEGMARTLCSQRRDINYVSSRVCDMSTRAQHLRQHSQGFCRDSVIPCNTPSLSGSRGKSVSRWQISEQIR